MKFPKFFSERAGWYLGAFLIGIVLHSFWPHTPVPIVEASILAAVFIAGYLLVDNNRSRFALVCLLMILFGILRFDAIRPDLADSVRPLDAKGFAYTRQVATNDLERWMENHRNAMSARIRSVLPGDDGALLAGILYGERSLSKDAKQDFKNAGLTHIIAVSGSNVMIVVLALGKLFSLLGWSRKKSFAALTLALILFVLFVTPQAPVVRAAIMGWLMGLAPLVGRLPSSNRLLLVSAAAFVFWQPQSLVFDPSFALSFLAVIGLMTWGSWLDGLLEKKIPSEILRETLSATFGATLMTAPYSAWAFGQASIFGLLTNLAAVPLVPWVMGSGLLVVIFPYPIVALPAKGLLDCLLWIGHIPAMLGFGSTALLISPWFMLGLYLLISVLWFRLARNPQQLSDDFISQPYLSSQK